MACATGLGSNGHVAVKQILQSLKTGVTELVEVPAPRVRPGQVLVQTSRTLLSAGTERMLVAFGKANWLDKARQQPDKVRMVLEKLRTDGLAVTFEAVKSKLDQPLALGYCNVGVVVEVGAGVEGLAVGDRVASNGKHAEVVCVPKNLVARVPDAVEDEVAVFTVLAAIGLQGLRLVKPTLGECVVVTGLGLIGDGQRQCHRRRSLDPRQGSGRRSDRRRGLAFHRTVAASARPRSPCGKSRRRAHIQRGRSPMTRPSSPFVLPMARSASATCAAGGGKDFSR